MAFSRARKSAVGSSDMVAECVMLLEVCRTGVTVMTRRGADMRGGQERSRGSNVGDSAIAATVAAMFGSSRAAADER
jgi:hypothetical protein